MCYYGLLTFKENLRKRRFCRDMFNHSIRKFGEKFNQAFIWLGRVEAKPAVERDDLAI